MLTLIGALAAIGVGMMPQSNAGITSEANRLASHIRYTQLRAQSDIYSWRLVFTDDQTYELGPVIIPGPGYTPSTVPGSGANLRTLTNDIKATAGTVVRFDSWGRPTDDNGNVLANDQIITLTQGDLSQTITILANTGLIP